MTRAWVARHRSPLITATSGALVSALIAGIAVASGGYTAQRLDLGDTAVWVTNESEQAIGRANVAVGELNTVVAANGTSLDVVQSGSTVLVVDHDNGALDIVDPATAQVRESVPLPPVSPSVYLAEENVVIASDGDVWDVPVDRLSGYDPASQPTLSLGSGSVTSMDAAGDFFSFSPSTGDLSRLDAATGEIVSTVTIDAGGAEDSYQLTSVGGRWALLNATSRHLYLPGAEVDVSELIARDGRPVLQQAGPDGDRVLLSHFGGLAAVPLSGGQPMDLVQGRSGRPAAPVYDGTCSYAAWGDGTSWRSCPGDSPGGAPAPLDGVAGDARLQFRSNGSEILLNDARNGAAWSVAEGNTRIDNWADLIDSDPDVRRLEDSADDTAPEVEQAQVPPIAVDDDFGARPGRAVTLPLLLNDHDPNGDVLVITELTGIPASEGHLDLVGNNQQVQLRLPDGAARAIRFGYTVSDGRGGTASATVTVTIRPENENSPPQQVRTTRVTVQDGGRVTRQVLGDWVDPDSDPLFLASATAIAPDLVGFVPEGTVVFTEARPGVDTRQVGVTVSDGRSEGSGTITVDVRPSGSVPIVAEPFVALTTAGEALTVSPLTHVRGGSGSIRLSSVPPRPDVDITPDFDGGTFTFSSGRVGTHYIDYAVTDGHVTASGMVRVEVAPAPDPNTAPVTVPHLAFVRGQDSTLVDVLATDIDPAGGVLLVTGISHVPAESGLRVEILEQRIIRVTLTRPLESGSAAFTYRVGNGLADAEGTVTVIEIPEPTRRQAPVAVQDSVSVRTGDAIDIPVLDNDEHPDDDPLTLSPDLVSPLPAGSGLLFTSGGVLRYLAPAKTGNFTAVYRVDAPDGQYATAEVRISVREADPASNNPPVPKTLTARVLAGDAVRIPVPVTGIDPDGDSVQLVGHDTNPAKGAVIDVGADFLEYQAGEYSSGTDTFTYTVVDALGARATGTVRVGISPRDGGARNPVAVEDEVLARPGSAVGVRVLDNDSDPDGGRLSVVRVEASGPDGLAVIDGEVVVVTAPTTEGRYGFIYEIQNERGGTSSNFLTVTVTADAPLSRPVASDTRLTLSDVLGRRTIDVDVLANVFFADGPTSDLGVGVLPGYAGDVTVTASKRIRVVLGDDKQIIPFVVSHPDDPSVQAHAFIWVPGFSDALPQLRRGAPALKVVSESTLTIDINEHVVAVGGKHVSLTESSTVKATNSDGADLVGDADTLVFTSASGYFGPASISFEVTDGTSPSDPDARTATIVLPITVTPRENQPPSFSGAVIELEPDQTKVIDLTRLTTYPYPDDQRELAYTVLDPRPAGFTWSLTGQQLSIRSNESLASGSTASFTIGVRDGLNAGRSGRIDMRIVASTRPIAVPAPDQAVAERGRTTVIDVLANDDATNPFPQIPLRVVAVRGLDSQALPSGISIAPSPDNSRLSVTVAPGAAAADTVLQYQVADATGDPDRYAWGSVRVSVQDRPDPVTNLAVTGFGDRRLSLAFNPGGSNNSAVSGYEITLQDAATGTSLGTITCPATTCEVQTPRNGQAMTVSVAARNQIGLSTATVLADPVWSDVIPEAPTDFTATPLDGGLRLAWATVTAAGGSTVRSYLVEVDGQARVLVDATGPSCTATACSVEIGGIANGSSAALAVSARNDADPGLAAWNRAEATGTPFGPARAGGISASGTDANGTVTVTWDAFDGNGDPILGYYVQRLSGDSLPTGDEACQVSSPAPGQVHEPRPGGSVQEQKAVVAGVTSVEFGGLTAADTRHHFVVWGYNRAGCAATPVQAVDMRPAPGAVTSIDGGMGWRGSAWDYEARSVEPRTDHYMIRTVGSAGEGETFGGQGWIRELLSLPFGSPVRFEIRACSEWACGPWSAQEAPEPSLSFTVSDLGWDATTGTFTWSQGPSNGDLPTGYECRMVDDPSTTRPGFGNTCSVGGVRPSTGAARLTVTVNDRAYSYER